jgi:hypothetical protein
MNFLNAKVRVDLCNLYSVCGCDGKMLSDLPNLRLRSSNVTGLLGSMSTRSIAAQNVLHR